MGNNTQTKQRKQGGRTSDIEIQQRLDTVKQWITDGLSTPQVIEKTIQTWGISQGHAYRYLRMADGSTPNTTKRSSRLRRNYHIAARQKLLNGVLDDNPAMALKILQDMAQMEGLYAPRTTAKKEPAPDTEKTADGTPPPTAITLSNGTLISLG